MPKMTLAQARKMRDGVLKGDSAMSRAWKELLGQIPEPPEPTEERPSEASKERKELGLPDPDELYDTEGW